MMTTAMAANALLFASAFALWVRLPHVWMIALAAAIGLALVAGQLPPIALVPVALVATACILASPHYNRRSRTAVRILAAAGAMVVALMMGLHLFPGFTPYRVFDGITLGAATTPYTASVRFDSAIAGILLLGLCVPRLASWEAAKRAFAQGGSVALATVVVVLAVGWAVGYVEPDPKWTGLFLPWLMLNLLTCIAEETFFRGMLQRGLAAALTRVRYGEVLGVVIAALLFGVAHAAGGMTYVALAALAGVGYGWVYRVTGSIEASILTHLSLNAVHFLLFTYPRLT